MAASGHFFPVLPLMPVHPHFGQSTLYLGIQLRPILVSLPLAPCGLLSSHFLRLWGVNKEA